VSRAKSNKVASATKPSRSKAVPRRPTRGPGILRFNSLLDATERLLADHSPDDIGLYQIGEAAEAPMASVYHFFPTRDAAFLALAERYLQGFRALGEEPVQASALRSWQDLAAIDQRRAVDFYNSHPPALKIFYGGYGSLETRQADIRYTRALAASLHHRLDAAFHMPPLRDATTKFHIALALLDAVWAISFEAHGRITEAFYEEGKAAFVAYCSLFLPPRLEPREACLAAAAKGATIQLPQLVPA
jgi:AcrR family transcriptional regulator